MGEIKIIECNTCESKVSANVLSKKEYLPDYMYESQFCYYFLECNICGNVMIGYSELIQVDHDEFEYDMPIRLWPSPKRYLDRSIPKIVRKSIREALKCYRAKAFNPCAVMCGCSIEALCNEHFGKKMSLSDGLKNLKDKGIIDGRLFEWGEALRVGRNLGAHP